MFGVLPKTISNKWQNIGINNHILYHHRNSAQTAHVAAKKQVTVVGFMMLSTYVVLRM